MSATHPAPSSLRALVALPLLLVLGALLGGCAMVEVKSLEPSEFIAMKRGDILTTGELSAATVEAIRVAGLDEGACARPGPACIDALAATPGLADERHLAALTELWVQQALALERAGQAQSDAQMSAWLEAARHAYAYLFLTGRTPGERAFEERQIQVRDQYNYAVQEATTGLFGRRFFQADGSGGVQTPHLPGWRIRTDLTGVRLPAGASMPEELIPASTLSFAGLRSIYRRDGLGSELVAVNTPAPSPPETPGRRREGERPPPYREMPSPSLSVVLQYPGDTLAQVLATREVVLLARDPYRESELELHGQKVPLAANFTAGYGLWLARSGFATQALRTLLGREQGIDRPHVYLMQPYDPQRRIILMLHGLGSSPEAWVNLANEVLGDEALRQRFQVWQVYYPTNLPISVSNAAIRDAFARTLAHFDPDGTAPASRDIVLIGHSMGGVVSRLMVSSSGDTLWTALVGQRNLDEDRRQRVRRRLQPLLRFDPVPGVSRAIFIAAPHRGTEAAHGGLGRQVAKLVRLPLTLLENFDDALRALDGGASADSDGKPLHIPNSIENLSENDPFLRAAAELPIAPAVRYHSIIAQRDPKVPLLQSDDGLVPYRSSHLDGAASEKVIVSGHSVQETPAAILEIRRILHEDLRQKGTAPSRPVSPDAVADPPSR